MSYSRGDFSFLKSDSEKAMLEDAMQAMERVAGSWDYLAQPDVPSQETGFMFSKDALLSKIGNEVDKEGLIGHSGSSYGWTMRQIEFIAKNGWEAYVTLRIENEKKREEEEKARKAAAEKPPRYFNDPFFNEMRSVPHLNAQIEEAERVAASQGGKLSYYQIRSIMG
jgi:hypothetical protein